MYFCSNKDGIKIDDKYVLMHAFVVVVVVIRTKPKLFKNIYFRKKFIWDYYMQQLHQMEPRNCILILFPEKNPWPRYRLVRSIALGVCSEKQFSWIVHNYLYIITRSFQVLSFQQDFIKFSRRSFHFPNKNFLDYQQVLLKSQKTFSSFLCCPFFLRT